MTTIRIGVTDCSKYENYYRWLAGEKNVEVIRLSPEQNNISDFSKCQAMVLSGGEDVHPRYYNKPELFSLCHEVDERRDDFEWRVMDYATQSRLPVLGICRGLQVVNVYMGGTLLPHIPIYGKYDHSKKTEFEDRQHRVHVDPNSILSDIVDIEEGEINSAHHQCADLIGNGLVTNALSPDGVIEGLERQNKNGPFLLLVQWHPERMKDLNSAFSRNVKEKFIEAIRAQ